MGQTFAEKVLSKMVGREVHTGDFVEVYPHFCLSDDNVADVIRMFKENGFSKLYDPRRIVIVLDHAVPAPTEIQALAHKETRQFVAEYGLPYFFDMNSDGGICHQLMCQNGFALPGTVIVGSDSHTCTEGALGAFAVGIGRTEATAVWVTGKIWMIVPRSFRVEISGSFLKGVFAKDLILRIIGDMGSAGADYASVEFHGTENLSIAERMTLCNMGIEMGAKNAVCRPDKTVMDFITEPKRDDWEPLWADEDAHYDATCFYKLENIVPALALPHEVDNFAPVEEHSGRKIDQAFIGTCTNSRIEDLRICAHILRERRVRSRTIIVPASWKVYRDAMNEGLIAAFLDAGCVVGMPGCGPCMGIHGGVLAAGEVCISTANRNFAGRMGNLESAVYLASPATVAWSAVCGEIRDPREVF